MSRRETATKLIAQKAIIAMLTEADKESRKAALSDFDKVGVREIGEIGDVNLGSVQLTKGRESWVVSDHRELLAWVQANRPDMIVTTPSVNPAFVESLKKACKADGGILLDEGTGEFGPPPGMESRTGEPILTVNPSPEARAAVLEALGVEPRKMLGLGGDS